MEKPEYSVGAWGNIIKLWQSWFKGIQQIIELNFAKVILENLIYGDSTNY